MNARTFSSHDRRLSLNRVFDQAFGGANNDRVWVPAMDVAERGDAYLVQAELPGVSPEQVDVTFEQNVLTIRGTKSAGLDLAHNDELRYFAAERARGDFERSVRLPEFVDAHRVAASFEGGVLFVTVPKAEGAKPRKIAIDASRPEGRINDGGMTAR